MVRWAFVARWRKWVVGLRLGEFRVSDTEDGSMMVPTSISDRADVDSMSDGLGSEWVRRRQDRGAAHLWCRGEADVSDGDDGEE